MTLLERDEMMRAEGREEGRAEERVNTEKERARANAAEASLLETQQYVKSLEMQLHELRSRNN